MVLYASSLLRWLQRKRYQYEVTFSLYMLSPTEKFVFNSFLFLVLSMIVIAASLYLPEHVSLIMRRLTFYWGGEDGAAAQQVVQKAAKATATAVTTAVAGSEERVGMQGAHDEI